MEAERAHRAVASLNALLPKALLVVPIGTFRIFDNDNPLVLNLRILFGVAVANIEFVRWKKIVEDGALLTSFRNASEFMIPTMIRITLSRYA